MSSGNSNSNAPSREALAEAFFKERLMTKAFSNWRSATPSPPQLAGPSRPPQQQPRSQRVQPQRPQTQTQQQQARSQPPSTINSVQIKRPVFNASPTHESSIDSTRNSVATAIPIIPLQTIYSPNSISARESGSATASRSTTESSGSATDHQEQDQPEPRAHHSSQQRLAASAGRGGHEQIEIVFFEPYRFQLLLNEYWPLNQGILGSPGLA
ncbi:hypothetical protein F52700_7528 [Fusarium sp. NRRL 52700]|nr:hypothetical protein F52700_7528 [Fusarium sp. NRRL 52700]